MKPTDILSKDEIVGFTQRSDALGWWMVISNWAIIALTFSVIAVWTNPITLLLGALLLAGRQLGLAVLMHEAGHKTLFKTDQLNRMVGQWLCAYPVLGDCLAYGSSHRIHHRTAGTPDDPDLPNYQSYPVTKASFLRKLNRDFSGQTGIKLLAATLVSSRRNMMLREGEQTNAAIQGLVVNALLFLTLAGFGVGELYFLWVIAYVFIYPAFARIRQVAEHGAVPNLFNTDPRLNTRTTLPRWYERPFISPNFVNYHLEHHLLASVPCYRLPRLHRRLKARGFYDGHQAAIAKGYWDVITRAVPEFAQETANTQNNR
jgi:fatty acid desaturase